MTACSLDGVPDDALSFLSSFCDSQLAAGVKPTSLTLPSTWNSTAHLHSTVFLESLGMERRAGLSFKPAAKRAVLQPVSEAIKAEIRKRDVEKGLAQLSLENQVIRTTTTATTATARQVVQSPWDSIKGRSRAGWDDDDDEGDQGGDGKAGNGNDSKVVRREEDNRNNDEEEDWTAPAASSTPYRTPSKPSRPVSAPGTPLPPATPVKASYVKIGQMVVERAVQLNADLTVCVDYERGCFVVDIVANARGGGSHRRVVADFANVAHLVRSPGGVLDIVVSQVEGIRWEEKEREKEKGAGRSFGWVPVRPPPACANNRLTVQFTTTAQLAKHWDVFLTVPSLSAAINRTVSSFYDIQVELSAGSFGVVHRGARRSDGAPVAIKVIPKLKLSEEAREKLEIEYGVLRQLSHPGIVKLMDVFDEPDRLYIVTELAEGGDMFDRLAPEGVSEPVVRRVMAQLFSACEAMHGAGIIHRDLKLENVLVVEQGPLTTATTVKLCDFGTARAVGGVRGRAKTFCGTSTYFAPEVIRVDRSEMEAYGAEADCWSLGVMAFALFRGAMPFWDGRMVDSREVPLHEQITKGMYTFTHSNWQGVSDEAKDLIRGLLNVDPARRLTAKEALRHPWVSGTASTAAAATTIAESEGNNGGGAGGTAAQSSCTIC